MPRDFEELDFQQTPLGAVSLRRRRVLAATFGSFFHAGQISTSLALPLLMLMAMAPPRPAVNHRPCQIAILELQRQASGPGAADERGCPGRTRREFEKQQVQVS